MDIHVDYIRQMNNLRLKAEERAAANSGSRRLKDVPITIEVANLMIALAGVIIAFTALVIQIVQAVHS